ncbi:MAG: DUF1559 domain-containing protein, partial [Thermoguttaceae bacterium]
TLTSGTSNVMVASETLLALSTIPAKPTKKDWRRLAFLDTQLNGARANIDLISLAERASPTDVSNRGFPWLSGRVYATGYTSYYTPNTIVPDCWIRGDSNYYIARSTHSGGVNVCMGDGSVSFCSDSVALDIWRIKSVVDGRLPVVDMSITP